MTDLIAFITARLDEDEATARAATQAPWWHNPEKQWLGAEAFEKYDLSKGEEYVGYGESPFSGCIAATGPASHAQSMADAEHIARHDPARVLREVEAKRRLLATFEVMEPDLTIVTNNPYGFHPGDDTELAGLTLALLAAAWSDHPEFDESWALPTS